MENWPILLKVNLQENSTAIILSTYSEACFPNYVFLNVTESVKIVRLEFPCWHCRRQTIDTRLFLTMTTGVVCPDFVGNVLPELLQRVDLKNMIHLCFIHDIAASHFL